MPETLSLRQLAILQHALGVDRYGQGTTHRNHFCAGGGDETICQELVIMGYMKTFERSYYLVTEMGKAAMLIESPKPPKLTDICFKAWPSISFPRFLQVLGFEDVSWGNDACARAIKYLSKEAEDRQFPVLECWVAEDSPEAREFPTSGKFRVIACLDRAMEDGGGISIHEGEDAVACKIAIEEWLGRR